MKTTATETKPSPVEELTARLSQLEGERAKLLARRQELTAKADSVDPLRASESVAAIQVATGELTAIARTLASIEAAQRETQAQLAAAREAAKIEATALERQAAQEQRQRALVDIVAGVQALDRALGAYISSNNAVIVAHGGRDMRVLAALPAAVTAQLQRWRTAWPEALGLPPALTRQEVLIAEARADLARAEELRDAARKTLIGEGTRNEHSAYEGSDAKIERVSFDPIIPGSKRVEQNVETVNRFDDHVDAAKRRLGELLNEAKGGG